MTVVIIMGPNLIFLTGSRSKFQTFFGSAASACLDFSEGG